MTGLLLTIIRLFLFLVLAGFITSFITSNHSVVSVELFPLPYALDMPLYAFGLGMLLLGLIAGGMIAGASALATSLHARTEKHAINKQLKAKENELKALQMEASLRKTPSSALLSSSSSAPHAS